MLTGREHEFEELTARADEARAGRGGIVIVCGESGGGKTSFVETFVENWSDNERIMWAGCDPLSPPRPLGPIHDLAGGFGPTTQKRLRDGDRPHDIFSAVFDEFCKQPSVLVIDDLHWADQGTVDLLRFVLRRVHRTHLFIVGTVRDDEIPTTHPIRSLLGDVARSASATSLVLPPLSLEAVSKLVGSRAVDPVWLHGVTGGNAFFVVEMLDHSRGDLPTTVRDAILSRTVGLDVAAWDLLHLLASAPGAIPDYLLADLGVTVPALRAVAGATLIRRTDHGVAFRHDLCRLAVASVIPPGAEAALHRRMIYAYESASQTDPAILTHHALGAGDADLIQRAASDAGRVAARSGAHTQAAQFYAIALERGGALPADTEAELLELLADEYFLTDRLDDAIGVRRRALHRRDQAGATAAVSANHHALAVYEWNNANRSAAEHHAGQAAAVLDGRRVPGSHAELVLLGHALTTQAYFAVVASDLRGVTALVSHAREIADRAGDPTLAVRVGIIDGYRGVLAGEDDARNKILSILGSAPERIDDPYLSGYVDLAFLDIEHRRLDQAAQLLDIGIALSIERDVPLGRSWLLGLRARLELLLGDWDDAVDDAENVLDSPSAPLARVGPLLVRARISLRCDGPRGDSIDEAWRLLRGFGEPLRLFAAAVIAERAWLSGTPDDRLEECRTLLHSCPVDGWQWARGELAMWLNHLGPSVDAGEVADPYRMFLDGAFAEAADEFHRLSMPYDAALALVASGDADLARRGLDVLDELGADAVGARVRRDLRARGVTGVPARRRSTTLTNPAGLTTRQIDVLRLMGDGLTNAELAERLYLSVKTIDKHVSAILAKLQAANRRDAVRRAREVGILG